MLKNIKINFAFIICILMISGCSKQKNNTNYYFHPTEGSDSNLGMSIHSPFKSIRKLSQLKLKSGDSIFLAAGEVFTKPLIIKDIIGSQGKPIIFTTYPKSSTKYSSIQTKGEPSAVFIENSSFVEIKNLDISAQPNSQQKNTKGSMRCGVLVHATKPGNYQHIYLSNLKIHDVFYNKERFTRPKGEVKTANGTQAYGWGIRFINDTENAKMSNIKIENSTIKNVAHTGIKLTSRRKSKDFGIKDFIIKDNEVLQTGGPGIQMSGVYKGHILNNNIDKSGSKNDSRKWGRGSGLWTWGSSNVLIEHNRFTNANGPGDSAGAHIDFNCKNIVLQYNFSANNAGGFCEILGNNYNCAYRYNISFNDGHRIKGENGAFQQGKIFWLSGYVGSKKAQSGPFNSYFYNNTIFVGEDIIPKIAIHRKAKGVLIANNIFHFKNPAEIVKGDQYNPETAGDWQVENVFFRNNLFLTEETWPKNIPIQDESPVFGNANFKNVNKLNIKGFVPYNKDLIANKSIKIQKVTKDSIGIIYSLRMSKDILGKTIQDKPDIGAIEIK